MNSNDQGHVAHTRGISTFSWALIGFLAISAFFLFSEHRAHYFSLLPWFLLLACPFLHFLHGGHGDGEHGEHTGHGQVRGPGDPT